MALTYVMAFYGISINWNKNSILDQVDKGNLLTVINKRLCEEAEVTN